MSEQRPCNQVISLSVFPSLSSLSVPGSQTSHRAEQSHMGVYGTD